ncbi:MAG: CBS domain-containing protein, partial [Paracoccaceae bacterium]|nr:CBS domain-containing protein [Paracoccaceae bacterium]
MLVDQILKSKSDTGVVTIAPGMSIAAAAELLSSKRIGAVVVSKDGVSPLGILSERDIVRELGKRGTGCLTDQVDALMTRKLVSCAPNDLADAVLAKMTEGRFRHMPVMKGEQMVGLISIGDVVKARLSELA